MYAGISKMQHTDNPIYVPLFIYQQSNMR